ncbi:hypothetical protein [Streptomyces sp. NBC_01408]|uniref:hypothetical protein n=1 Tax=Streptomyces sp. NBC_01408 TaxID=2903855 RepID=UPI00225105B9|nr:hypothetical protein [Streptomyces sp. NBC_01408]MCX4691295.1 hypothetical protein [Streptomyces sp. NBC_01408]
MSMRHVVNVRGGAAVAVAAVLTLMLAGCGGGDGKKSAEPQKSSTPKAGSDASAPAPSTSQTSDPAQVLATVTGEGGISMVINSVNRDAGGFLTVSGQIKNSADKDFTGTAVWRGNELTTGGESVAGATLVDRAGKKRYYVLRDTEGRCLCTTGVSRVKAGATIPFFAQFPAPPATTTEVDFTLPTFATATIKISG